MTEFWSERALYSWSGTLWLLSVQKEGEAPIGQGPGLDASELRWGREYQRVGTGEDTFAVHIEAVGIEDLRLMSTGINRGVPPSDQVPALTCVILPCPEI